LRAASPAPGADGLPAWERLEFDQQAVIEKVREDYPDEVIVPDSYELRCYFFPVPARTRRRLNFDMAGSGFIYLPEVYKDSVASPCRVHVALHGCKPDANGFARTAGYNKGRSASP